ncbi:MAG: polyphenol oxidase family protein [Verrucomicrobiales bacterium]|nr:polyphenol oxidase family protein [Verrucomicrobiales bacterium]
MIDSPFIETYPALSAISGLTHGFITRHPDIDVKTDRETALLRLEEHHVNQLRELGIDRNHLTTGEQVHGKSVAAIDPAEAPEANRFGETDGLTTGTAGQYLGIFVADCGAVFLADPVMRVAAVVHSGKKGTELGIAPEAIRVMQEKYGSNPGDIVVQIAPCIRPPAYEIDFAAQIVDDCVAAGVPASQVYDCGVCTSSDLERYYSYRIEMGQTGRLFAVIGWEA